MKSTILLSCAFSIACVFGTQANKHESEAAIAAMSPAQRVDHWVSEQVHHRFDLSDDQGELVRKYVLRDGLKALPRLIEIIDLYDPTRFREGVGRKGERFDAASLMLDYLDRQAIRLRGSKEGQAALTALERAIQRMQAAGYGQKGQKEWHQHGRVELALSYLQAAKGVNLTDLAIRDTLRLEHKTVLSDEMLLAFSNFLVTVDPNYPNWSETAFIKDYSQINDAGFPSQIYVMKKTERFYKSYLEFKKAKQ